MISKIHLLSELEEIAAKLKKAGKVVVHCHGTFDLMHPGHIKHFEAAKKQEDVLNAVSPGLTGSLAFADYVVSNIIGSSYGKDYFF